MGTRACLLLLAFFAFMGCAELKEKSETVLTKATEDALNDILESAEKAAEEKLNPMKPAVDAVLNSVYHYYARKGDSLWKIAENSEELGFNGHNWPALLPDNPTLADEPAKLEVGVPVKIRKHYDKLMLEDAQATSFGWDIF